MVAPYFDSVYFKWFLGWRSWVQNDSIRFKLYFILETFFLSCLLVEPYVTSFFSKLFVFLDCKFAEIFVYFSFTSICLWHARSTSMRLLFVCIFVLCMVVKRHSIFILYFDSIPIMNDEGI